MLKQLYCSILCLFILCGIAQSQYVNLPDSNFRNALMARYPGCFNAAKQLDTSCAGILFINNLFIPGENIQDLTGIQYFKSLTSLVCSGNKLTSLPQLPATLTDIFCDNNLFTTIPDLPEGIKGLSIYKNQITRVNKLPNSLINLVVGENPVALIDSLPHSLQNLSCGIANLSALPTLPVTLTQLLCHMNPHLTQLPTLPPGLKTLWCNEDSLTVMPALPPDLEYLTCDKNFLTALPTLPNKLKSLSASTNKLTSLPNIPDSLEVLVVTSNQITSLPAMNTNSKLLSINCSYNQLTLLPLLPNNLVSLNLESNLVTSLPTALPDSLTYIYATNNKLTALPATLPNILRTLFIGSNQISALPPLPDSLKTFNADLNRLTSINLPEGVTECYVAYNPTLTSLGILPKTLMELSLMGDSLGCLPFLPASLVNLYLYSSNVRCIPNLPSGTNIFPPKPICSATNNAANCQAYPQIYGFVYNDNNNNNRYDAGDEPRRNVKSLLSNGSYAFTNDQGWFNIAADTIGSYNVTLLPPPLFAPTPLTYVHNFSSYTAEVHDTFALKATRIKDSVSVYVTPLATIPRPGFAFGYNVIWENVGSTILQPYVAMKLDTSRIRFDSSNIPGITLVQDSLRIPSASLAAGEFKSGNLYFTVSRTAPLGSLLIATAVAKAGPAFSTDSSKLVIRGSYDPNDKQATPVLTPTQVITGEFIDYTIRFQNTGTDTAFTVVIADTLSSYLQTNVLQIIGSSHPCRTTLSNGRIYFEFLNILLPDSNVNSLKSNGFIRFRIAPRNSVVLGDSIANTASIYFDYNDPIVTNTVQTHIRATTLPLSLLRYAATAKGNAVLNEWTTVNELNTAYFNIQRSVDGRRFDHVGRLNARNRASEVFNYTYSDDIKSVNTSRLFYRLEMVDRDGKITYSPVRIVSLNGAVELSIYPNPASNLVTISGANMNTVQMRDNIGRLVLQKNITGQTTVDLRISHLPKGIYMVQLTGNDGAITTKKLIIE